MINLIKRIIQSNFFTFCIIGGINTLIHLLVYNIFYELVHPTIANTIAFIVASVFSYFANARYTYKKRATSRTFYLAFIAFFVKLLASDGLEWFLRSLFQDLKLPELIPFNPIFITLILIPIQFLVFNRIFSTPELEKEMA